MKLQEQQYSFEINKKKYRILVLEKTSIGVNSDQ